MRRRALLILAAGVALARPALADVPVIDLASIAQAIKQIEWMRDQYQVMTQSLRALTNSLNLNSVAPGLLNQGIQNPLGSITGQPSTGGAIDAGSPNVTQIARSLFTDHLWAFEITSVLLVIAVVGAVTLARHRGEALVDDAHPGDDVPTSATAEERA